MFATFQATKRIVRGSRYLLAAVALAPLAPVIALMYLSVFLHKYSTVQEREQSAVANREVRSLFHTPVRSGRLSDSFCSPMPA